MSLGCADALQQMGVSVLPPITGEAMNGWMRRWKTENLQSIGPICPPGLSAAAVRAAVALLEGKPVHKHYVNRPAPVTTETLDKYVRMDLSDAYWSPSEIPEAQLQKYYGGK
jgi:ribose transport system substrate-binding protein